MQISGSIPALITPFLQGTLHLPTLKRLIDWHIEQGSSGVVVCGTTGESPTLSHEERIILVKEAVLAAAGRIPVIAGAGSNSTKEALELSQACEVAGADGLLHVTGYYNKPTQRQVIEHFRTLDRGTKLPILVYNIPARTGQELSIETIAELAQLEHVVGVKDSTGNVARLTLERLTIKKPFSFLSGDDGTSLGYMAHGGHGCVSVTANVAPALCAQMISAARQGDFVTASALQDRLMALHVALFLEPSPAGVKYAMSKLGLCANELRGPLTPATESTHKAIDEAMKTAGVC